jgi:hypothetical protein
VILKDFDFHPDEDAVRVFTAGSDGVLRFDDDVCVAAPVAHVPIAQVPFLSSATRVPSPATRAIKLQPH